MGWAIGQADTAASTSGRIELGLGNTAQDRGKTNRSLLTGFAAGAANHIALGKTILGKRSTQCPGRLIR